ncbi:MAG: Urea transporter ATP-binding protein UrtD [Pseudomonadota bacterium]|jgi:urea transport system ATP-binding protein
MMGEPHLLEVEQLSVSFDGFKAVDDLTLYVDNGEIRALIGPNGAGKTTLLDLISGKTRSSQGQVKFKGREITRLREHEIVQAGIGRKFQTPSVYEELTVFENLEMAYPSRRTWWGALCCRRTPEVVERVHEVAELIYLQDRLQQRAEELGHGQKQWLEIGLLLMQSPELMMLDEPVAGMSMAEREKTAELLRRMCQGRAVLVVEHDMKFVESIADTVTVLHQGKRLAEGKMSAVKNDAKVIDVYLGH